MNRPPPVQTWPGAVLLQGLALHDARFLVANGIRATVYSARHRTREFEGILRAIEDALEAVSPTRRRGVALVVETVAAEGQSSDEADTVSTKTAGAMAGVHQRTIQRWCEDGLGWREEERWRVERARLVAHIAERKAQRHGN